MVGPLIIIAALSTVPPPASAKTDAWSRYGDITQIALPVSAAAISLAKGDYTGLKQFGYTFALTMGTTFVLKPLVNERRPNGGRWSFPSGHTASAFAASSYLWMRYGKSYGIPATILAAAVGYSRVESKHHYWHDVLAGAALGTLSSLLFTKNINLSVSSHGAALSYSTSF